MAIRQLRTRGPRSGRRVRTRGGRRGGAGSGESGHLTETADQVPVEQVAATERGRGRGRPGQGCRIVESRRPQPLAESVTLMTLVYIETLPEESPLETPLHHKRRRVWSPTTSRPTLPVLPQSVEEAPVLAAEAPSPGLFLEFGGSR